MVNATATIGDWDFFCNPKRINPDQDKRLKIAVALLLDAIRLESINGKSAKISVYQRNNATEAELQFERGGVIR